MTAWEAGDQRQHQTISAERQGPPYILCQNESLSTSNKIMPGHSGCLRDLVHWFFWWSRRQSCLPSWLLHSAEAFFFKSSVKVITLTELPDYRSFECLHLSVTVQSTKLRLIVVYRSPDKSRAKFLAEFSSLLESVSTVPAKLVIIGNFNLHVDTASDSYAQRFLDIIDSLGFRQEVNGPTHNLGHTLDLVLLRESDCSGCEPWIWLWAPSLSTTVTCLSISDHSVIECTLKTRPTRWPTKTISFRSFKGNCLFVCVCGRGSSVSPLNSMPCGRDIGSETTTYLSLLYELSIFTLLSDILKNKHNRQHE